MSNILKVEEKINELDLEINRLEEYYLSKQSDRVMSNYIWISSFIEERIISRIKILNSLLEQIKLEYYKQFRITKQFDAPIVHCTNMYNLLNEILYLYKINADYTDIKLKLQFNIPKILENKSSLRNRFTIMKNNMNKGLELKDIKF